MSFIRRYGLLVVGGILLVIGVLEITAVYSQPAASFGWTAYAPLTSTTFDPLLFRNVGLVLAGVVALWVGAGLVAGRVAFMVVRRFRRRPHLWWLPVVALLALIGAAIYPVASQEFLVGTPGGVPDGLFIFELDLFIRPAMAQVLLVVVFLALGTWIGALVARRRARTA